MVLHGKLIKVLSTETIFESMLAVKLTSGGDFPGTSTTGGGGRNNCAQVGWDRLLCSTIPGSALN